MSRRMLWPITGSGIVGGHSGPQPVNLHGWILAETSGTSKVTVDLYVPTVTTASASHPPNPDASGTHVAQLIVPAGTTFSPWYEDEEIFFKDGLYVAVGGTGTLVGSLIIS